MERISQRAAAYGIPGVTVDGQDVLAVFEATSQAVNRARTGEGPTLIENLTYRYKGHSRSDQQAYRTRDEVKEWQTNRDPIMKLRDRMIQAGLLTPEEAATMDEQAEEEIAQAVEFAEASPEPDPANLLMGVYA